MDCKDTNSVQVRVQSIEARSLIFYQVGKTTKCCVVVDCVIYSKSLTSLEIVKIEVAAFGFKQSQLPAGANQSSIVLCKAEACQMLVPVDEQGVVWKL